MLDAILHRRFRNRSEAGKALAAQLREYNGRSDVIVLALPRGGVPVAYEVAKELGAPLDVFIVRKLGVPGHPELAMGAVASSGDRVLNTDVIRSLSITSRDIDRVAAVEMQEIDRQGRAFRGQRAPIDVHGRIVVLV